MSGDGQHLTTSKFLSLVLRHQPEVIWLELDENGWINVDDLVTNAQARGRELTKEIVEELVAASDKQRFALSEDGLRIRANQGHSIKGVDLNFKQLAPPELLFHGTIAASLDSIRSQGLEKRSRQHVHLSADQETAKKVAGRRGKPVVLQIDAASMHADGLPFWISENGVWLVEAVPVQYILIRH